MCASASFFCFFPAQNQQKSEINCQKPNLHTPRPHFWCGVALCVFVLCTHVVAGGRPARVPLGVELLLFLGLFIVFGLLLFRQRPPLWKHNKTTSAASLTLHKVVYEWEYLMNVCPVWNQHTHHLAQNCVDSGAVPDLQLLHDLLPLLLPEDHEGVQRLSDVRTTVILLFGAISSSVVKQKKKNPKKNYSTQV